MGPTRASAGQIDASVATLEESKRPGSVLANTGIGTFVLAEAACYGALDQATIASSSAEGDARGVAESASAMQGDIPGKTLDSTGSATGSRKDRATSQ